MRFRDLLSVFRPGGRQIDDLGETQEDLNEVKALKRLSNRDQRMNRAIAVSMLVHGFVILFALFAAEMPEDLPDQLLKTKSRFNELIYRPDPKPPAVTKAPGRRASAGRAKGPKDRKRPKHQTKRRGNKAPVASNVSVKDVAQQVEKDLMARLKQKTILSQMSAFQKTVGQRFAGGTGGQGWVRGKHGQGDVGGGTNALGTLGGVGTGQSGWRGTADVKGDGYGRGFTGRCRSCPRRGRNFIKTKTKFKPTVGHIQIHSAGLDKAIIQRVIRQHRNRFRYCYERELIKQPQLRGMVHVYFRIEENGRVRKAQIKRTTVNNDRMEACILQRVRMFRFPQPKGLVDVNYPFAFQANQRHD